MESTDRNIEYLRVIIDQDNVKIEITIGDEDYKYIVHLDDTVDELLERLNRRVMPGKCSSLTTFSEVNSDRFGPKGLIGPIGECGTCCNHSNYTPYTKEETDTHKSYFYRSNNDLNGVTSVERQLNKRQLKKLREQQYIK